MSKIIRMLISYSFSHVHSASHVPLSHSLINSNMGRGMSKIIRMPSMTVFLTLSSLSSSLVSLMGFDKAPPFDGSSSVALTLMVQDL